VQSGAVGWRRLPGSAGNNEPIEAQGAANKRLVKGSDYEHRGFLVLRVLDGSSAELSFVRAGDGGVGDTVTLRH
jgi:hypothetical protein